MEIQENSVLVSRSLRYHWFKTDEQVDELIYVLHGYGQLSYYFLQKFQQINKPNCMLVAPEGMHRFYLNGTSGRVGASWMTREKRETDIQENTKALDQLHQTITRNQHFRKITILGFSQGGATASRWVAAGNTPCDHFISWASVFPPDISMENSPALLTCKKSFVLGNEDPFFDEKATQTATTFYQNLSFDIFRFDGKHDISSIQFNDLVQ